MQESSEVLQTPAPGVYISTAMIYDQIVVMNNRLIRVEAAQEESKPDANRIRLIQTQIAALWVMYGLMATVVGSNLIERLTP